MKDGNIGTDGEFDYQLSIVGGVVIVLDEPLADFARSNANLSLIHI